MHTARLQVQLAIIGGGAAGFFTAANLDNGKEVVILEKTGKLLSKVRISGGGRCNVTHHCFEPKELSTRYPRGQRFVQKAFHWFHAETTVQWFAERNVALHTEEDGRMFPTTNQSATIVQTLLDAAAQKGVNVVLNAGVEKIQPHTSGFELLLSDGRTLHAKRVVLACGAYPKLLQYQWLQALGHKLIAPNPSLFTFNLPGQSITALMGVSVPEVQVKIAATKFVQQGAMLITHWGLSGPAVLKLSAWAARELAEAGYEFTVLVNWLGKEHSTGLQERWPQVRSQKNRQPMGSKNPFGLATRLWAYLLAEAGIDENILWNDLKNAHQQKLIQLLTAHSFDVRGKTTFKEEFVTCGGIDTAQIDVNTMESKLHKGLYFAGEVMNVDGITGGYNFQHAWTSGYLVAKSINEANRVVG